MAGGRNCVGRLGALRVEVVDDALAVDGVADRLAHLLVVERRLVDVEAQVEDVQRVALDELEARVALDRLEVVGADVVDAVDGAGLQLDEALGRLRAPPEDDGLVRRGSPQ